MQVIGDYSDLQRIGYTKKQVIGDSDLTNHL